MHTDGSDEYEVLALKNSFPARDISKVEANFDRLVPTNKKTGNPTCPPQVRRAKHIGKDILTRAQVTS